MAVFVLGISGCAIRPPESAVSCAVDAARDGDREAYAACFTPRSRAFLGSYWHTIGEARPDLLALGAADVQIREIVELAERDFGVKRAVAVLREGPREYRLVLHHEAGRWRIDLWDTRQAQSTIRGM